MSRASPFLPAWGELYTSRSTTQKLDLIIAIPDGRAAQGRGDMDYQLSFVRVFVTDWPRAIRFYTETLEMTPTLITDGWAQFATGEAQLALELVDPADPESDESVGRFVGVSLSVDDIDAAYQDVVSPRRRVSWRAGKATVGRRTRAPARPRRQRAHARRSITAMPIRTIIEKQNGLIQTTATGHVTGADLIDYYKRLRAHPDFKRTLNEIFDATEVETDRPDRRRRATALGVHRGVHEPRRTGEGCHRRDRRPGVRTVAHVRDVAGALDQRAESLSRTRAGRALDQRTTNDRPDAGQ